MLTLYFTCLVAGLLFAIASFMFSGSFESDVSMSPDAPDVHTGLDGDIGGIQFPLLSPIVLASFVTTFGGGGIVGLKLFDNSLFGSLAVAVGSGLLMALVVGFLVMKIFKKAGEVKGVAETADLIGAQAEVSEGIPLQGLGEITFIGKGNRINAPARSQDGTEIARHSPVTIVSISGGTFTVKKAVPQP